MKISKGKTATTIALFLMLTIAISLVPLPVANAQSTKETYPVIGATPNPVGVNQETLIMLGITQQLTRVGMGWEGLTVTVTKPDGNTETLGGAEGFTTDSTGLTGTVYVPVTPGNYTLQVHFPEQVTRANMSSPGTPTGTTMLASDSEELTLVVQEEPIEIYPTLPLPTEYWTRPIDSQLREWYTISGSWLGTPRNFLADPGNDDAPETAHILWAKPLTTGGLVGGEFGLIGSGGTSVGFETGDAYAGKWLSKLIIAGVLIYCHSTSIRPLEYTAVDLRTGEELWTRTFLDNRSISTGQLFYWQSYNYQGTYAYLWVTVGTTWYAFDLFDGTLRLTITNVPSGTTITGKNGEIYRYSINTRQGRMLLWNLSAIISMQGSFRTTAPGTYDASETTTAGQRAYALNFTFPTDLPGSVQAVELGDRVVGTSVSTTEVTAWAFSLKPGEEGSLLFKETWTAPAEWAAGNLSISNGAISLIDGVFTVNAKESRLRYGFSTETGKYLWTISEPIAMLGHLVGGPSGERGYIVYGKLICGTMSGVIQAYDVTNGELVWTYEVRDPYMQVLWSNNWPVGHVIVADGKLYIGNEEHSANQPLPRGGPFICLNATTGELIWRANGLFRQTVWGGEAIMGDSVIATMDTYDQRIYAIGKGPSATTVTAPDIGVPLGKSVLIRGTVTDVSPDTKDSKITMRFPNGVPAVADESMSDWMLYVYKQFPRPANVVGVEVVVSVLDPNSNYYEVGRTTGDASGFFSCEFTPEVPGKYTVIAEFEGSRGYYGSYAETALFVEEPPEATPAPTPSPAPMTDTYVMGFGIGIIIAIVAVGLILFLMLRKR